jgi:hypothetical protein
MAPDASSSPLPFHIEIPTIDLNLLGDGAARDGVLLKMRHALTDLGSSMYLILSTPPYPKHHQFAHRQPSDPLPPATRHEEQRASDNSPHPLGYSAVGSEMTVGKADAHGQVSSAPQNLLPHGIEGFLCTNVLSGQTRFASTIDLFSATGGR